MFFKKQKPKSIGYLRRQISLFVVLGLLLAGLFSYMRIGAPEQALAATSSNLNIQARLYTASGSVVPDGYYNIEFKMYDAVSSGSLLWTESWYDSNGVTAGNDNRVRVVNGYMSVQLGTHTALPSVNWDDNIWISLNVGGTTQTATPTYDGEMSPRIKLTSVPFALAARNVSSGNTSAASTNSGNISIQTGNATGTTSNSGNITLDVGTATQTAGTISVGTANTSGITIGRVGVVTDVAGNLTVSGSQFTNSGSTLNTTQSLGDFPAGGSIGSAATTVDVDTSFAIAQTTAGQTLSLPSPTSSTAGRIVYVLNSGSASFNMHGVTIPASYGQIYVWNGSDWRLGASGGGAAITLQAGYDGGNTITTTDARDIDFTLSNTSTDANFTIDIASGSTGEFKVQANSTDVLQIGSAGQLQLDTQGATGGILLGGDTNIYRSAANTLKTDDDFEVGNNLTITASSGNLNTSGNISTTGTGTITSADDLAVNGDSITTDDTTFNLFNTTATTINAFGAATTISLGAGSGTTTINNDLTVTGLLTANGDLTLQTGDTFTINGDALTDLTGSGLILSSNALTVDDSTATGFFRNGGNSFSGAATLGTNDANVLNFETDGTNRFQISASVSTLTGQGQTSINSSGGALFLNSSGGALWLGNSSLASGIAIGTNNASGNTINVGGASSAAATATGLSLQATSTINLGTSGSANTIQIGNTLGAVTQTINIGNNSTASSTNNVNIGSSIAGTTAITGPTTITNRTSGSADTLIISNSTSTGNILQARDNSTAVMTIADGGATTFVNETNSTAAFRIQNSGGSSTLLNADTTNMRVSVGTIGTATGQLYVSGAIPTTTTGSVAAASSRIYVQDKYAYTLDSSDNLRIFDISNPASPVSLSSTSLGSSITTKSIYVQGRYAYVVHSGGTDSMMIYDISNPYAPSLSGSVTTNMVNPWQVVVQGRYAYVVMKGTSVLAVYDISSPTNPTYVSNVGTGANPGGVYVQGRYAYVTNTIADTMSIYDISNPTNPASTGGSVSTGDGPEAIYVKDSYAYVISNSTTNNLSIVNVSNPASPSVTSSTNFTGTGASKVYAQGRYAYVANSGNGGLEIFDISNPSSPSNIGLVSASSIADFIVQGRYAYVSGGASFRVYDMGGVYTQQLEAGSVETTTLTVLGGASIVGNTSIQGGLTVLDSSNFSGGLSVGSLFDVTGSAAFRKGADFSTIGSSNNVNFGEVSLVRLTGASAQTVTGIANGRDGEILTIVNAASQSATISNNSGSSSAGNQIITGTGANITLAAGGSITLVYDSTSPGYWRVTGSVAFSTGNFIQNGTSQQTSANFNIKSASAGSVGAVIQGTTAQTADIFQLKDENNLNLLAVGANAGFAIQSSDGFTSTNAFTVGVVNSGVPTTIFGVNSTSPGVYTGSTTFSVFNTTATTINAFGAATTLSLGAGSGTTTVNNNLTVTSLLTANGNLTLQTGDTFTMNGDAFTDLTGDGLIVSGNALTVDTTSSTGFFRNGGNSFSGAATLGTNDGNVLNLETNNTTRFQIASSAAYLTGQGNTRIDSTGGTLYLGSFGTLGVSSGIGIGTTSITFNAINIGDSGGNTVNIRGGGINIGASGAANTVQIGNTSGAVTQTINIGNNATASSTNNVNIGSTIAGTTAIRGATTITNRTSGSADTLIISNSTSTGNILQARDNATAVMTISDGGATSFRNQTNSTAAFQVQDSAGTSNLFIADTTNTRIGVGAVPANSLLSIGTNTTTAPGGITFGTDTALYRYAADVLATDGSYFANGGNFFATTAYTGLSFSSLTNSGIYNTGTDGDGDIAIDNGSAGVPVITIAQGGATTFRNNSNSTAAFLIQSSGGSATLLNADTTNLRITIGGASGSLSGRALEVTSADVTTTLRVGDGTNGISFNDQLAGKLRFRGTAQNDISVTLNPEYAGAVLTGDGSNNVGTMTSDFCSGSSLLSVGISCAASEDHNYYSWTANANNDYDIFVKWKVPSDFASFAGTPIQFYGWKTASGDAVRVRVYESGNATVCDDDSLGTSAAWTLTTSNPATSCTISAGDELIFRITLSVGANGNYAGAGEIFINYKSEF